MADLEKGEWVGRAKDEAEEEEKEAEEKERLLDGMAVLDFDMLCSTVTLQSQQGKWRTFNSLGEDLQEDGGELGGVLRMWEGEVLDCFEDRRIALESAWCVRFHLFFFLFFFCRDSIEAGAVCFCGKLFPRKLFVLSRIERGINFRFEEAKLTLQPSDIFLSEIF